MGYHRNSLILETVSGNWKNQKIHYVVRHIHNVHVHVWHGFMIHVAYSFRHPYTVSKIGIIQNTSASQTILHQTLFVLIYR